MSEAELTKRLVKAWLSPEHVKPRSSFWKEVAKWMEERHLQCDGPFFAKLGNVASVLLRVMVSQRELEKRQYAFPLIKQDRGEGVMDFHNRLEKERLMLQALYPSRFSEAELLATFTYRLNDELQMEVESERQLRREEFQDPGNMTEEDVQTLRTTLLSMCDALDRRFRVQRKNQLRVVKATEDMDGANDGSARVAGVVGNSPLGPGGVATRQERRFPARRPAIPLFCHKCGGAGHFKRDCKLSDEEAAEAMKTSPKMQFLRRNNELREMRRDQEVPLRAAVRSAQARGDDELAVELQEELRVHRQGVAHLEHDYDCVADEAPAELPQHES